VVSGGEQKHKRPRGRAPNGKEWSYTRGEWIPQRQEPEAAADQPVHKQATKKRRILSDSDESDDAPMEQRKAAAEQERKEAVELQKLQRDREARIASSRRARAAGPPTIRVGDVVTWMRQGCQTQTKSRVLMVRPHSESDRNGGVLVDALPSFTLTGMDRIAKRSMINVSAGFFDVTACNLVSGDCREEHEGEVARNFLATRHAIMREGVSQQFAHHIPAPKARVPARLGTGGKELVARMAALRRNMGRSRTKR